MRVVAIKNPKSDAEHRLIHEMQRLRARIFRGRLAWAVRRTSGLEIVRFDTLRPTYVLCLDRSGSVIGCARFLPPTGGTMLEKVFPQGRVAKFFGGRSHAVTGCIFMLC